MDRKIKSRTPLKDLNSGSNVTPSKENKCRKLKRRRTSLITSPADQKTVLDHYKMNVSADDIVHESHKDSPDSSCGHSSAESPTEPVDFNKPATYIMLTANKCFMEDLRCPEFSPFSQISYSCSSVRSCKNENHKINVEQISETQEKALSFLAKSWYVLEYPLTCLITDRTYLSPFLLRFLFYGILDEKDEIICLKIKDTVKGHLKLHPPCNNKLNALYLRLLVGDVDSLDPSNPEIVTYNFMKVFTTIGKVVNELKNKPVIETEIEQPKTNNDSFNIPKDIDEFYQFFLDNYTKTGNILPPSVIHSNKADEEDKDKISPSDLLKRLFMVFSLMVDILEEDFRMWWMRSRYCLAKKLRSSSYSPILTKVAWDRKEDIGSVNKHCVEVFELFLSCPKEYKLEISRYITLLSEAVRANEENKERKFPFFSYYCNEFAGELAAHLKQDDDTITQEKVSLVQLIYPSWLKFKVCSFLLKSEVTSGGVDDLSSILKILQRNLTIKPKALINENSGKTATTSKNMNIKANKTDSSGETIIHKYCRANNFKALGIALRDKETNVNIADNAGWTPLHNSAHYNSIDCVKLLIKHRAVSSRGAEELNISALNSDNDTPLACAVIKGNDVIVDILLKNGGGVTVWNIVSSGLSIVEHAKSSHLKDMLIKAWETSSSLYKYVNMSPMEIDLIYCMLASYCKVYHINERFEKLDPDSCKHDSHYQFDYIQFCKDENTLVTLYNLVEKLCTCRLSPKPLKNLLFYLKRRILNGQG